MKNIKFIYSKIILLSGLLFAIIVSCEREISDEVEFATFSKTGEIFTDSPIGLGSNFYFPFAGSKATAWTVDDNEGYESQSSMRFDVPNADDPDGNYAGAIFRVDGAGRDLSEFDALTFWAKALQGVSIDAMGFGTDFEENKYQVTRSNISLSTNWVKYIIPIPDAFKLTNERGVFWYTAGTQATSGLGYAFWIDELKFEKLGTIAQPQPTILNGEDLTQQTFTGSEIDIAASGLTQTFNVAGRNVTVSATPAYFEFTSSNTNVAIVDEKGVVNLINEGSAEITAQLAGVEARGSLNVTSSGVLAIAPIPTRLEIDVKSIYSDAYVAATTSNFTPNFGGSTTQTTEVGSNGNFVQIYTNNNFTGIVFDNTVNASALTHLHVDIYTQNSDTNVDIQIRDIGANGEIETNVFNGFPDGDDKDFRFTASGLTVGSWTSFDIPLGGDLTAQKNNLGALILVGGPDFILDNIYFYKE